MRTWILLVGEVTRDACSCRPFHHWLPRVLSIRLQHTSGQHTLSDAAVTAECRSLSSMHTRVFPHASDLHRRLLLLHSSRNSFAISSRLFGSQVCTSSNRLVCTLKAHLKKAT